MGKASRRTQSLPADIGKDRKEPVSSNPPDKDDLFSRQVVHLLLIVVLGFLAYSNTFHNPFQWDEVDFIVGNPIIRNLGYFTDISRAEGLPVYDGLKSRYIGYLTFALNYKLHGFNVPGYHLVNLAIHLVNAIVVYFLVLLTFRTPYFDRQLSAISNNPPSSPLHSRGEQGGVAQFTTHHSRFTIHDSRFVALAVALLFVAHPIQTEAVTYIFQRLASLVSMFCLLSLVLYIKGRLSARQSAVSGQQSVKASRFTILWYLLSLLSAVFAMKTKENAFTLPVVITLYEFLFFSGQLKGRVLRLAPFLLTMLIVPLTIMGAGSTPGEIISQVKDPASLGYITPTPEDYLFTQFRVIVTYLRLLVMPVGQNLLYDYPIYQSFFAPPVLLSFLFLSALFGAAVYLVYKSRRGAMGNGLSAVSLRSSATEEGTPLNPPLPRGEGKGGVSPVASYRLIAFGILWFFITLLVESSIIPIPVVIDEYRVYLPSVGFFLAVAAGGALLVQRSPGISVRKVKMVAAFFCVVILALGAATYARNIVWKDKVSLWTDIVRKSPGLGMGYDNLGLSLEEAGRREEAIDQFKKASQLAPDVPTPRINLGYTLEAMGRLDEAIAEYQTVVRLAPRNWQAHLNLGSAYGKKGLSDKAIEEFQAALKINPNSAAVFSNLANAYRQKGDTEKEIDSYLKILQLAPDHPVAHYNLGRAYVQVKQLDKAIAELEAAVRLRPDDSYYRNTLGVLYGQKGLYDEAVKQFETAIRLAPDNAAYRQNLERARGLKSKQ